MGKIVAKTEMQHKEINHKTKRRNIASATATVIFQACT
jgi:hypothetical protein